MNYRLSETKIANYLRLLKLDPIIQTGIRDGFISMGQVEPSISKILMHKLVFTKKL
jgi:hypothetical protein